MTAFTAILAISTVGLFVATVGLWSYAAEQASDMKGAIAESRRSADAAKESTDVAKQSLVTVQRAFVFIDSFQVEVLNNELVVMPKWRNSGTTPTRFMTNWVSWKPFNSEPPDDFNFPDLSEGGNPVDEKDKKPPLVCWA